MNEESNQATLPVRGANARNCGFSGDHGGWCIRSRGGSTTLSAYG
jgi:hypothetical protein